MQKVHNNLLNDWGTKEHIINRQINLASFSIYGGTILVDAKDSLKVLSQFSTLLWDYCLFLY